MEKAAKWFKHFYTQNLDDIVPSEKKLYGVRSPLLSEPGFLVFWEAINNIICCLNRGELRQCFHKSSNAKAKVTYPRREGDRQHTRARRSSGNRGGTSPEPAFHNLKLYYMLLLFIGYVTRALCLVVVLALKYVIY